MVLAGAGGLAGLAGSLWPWRDESALVTVAAQPAPAGGGPTPAEDGAETPADETPVSASAVAAERESFARLEGEVFRVASSGFESTSLVLEKVGGLSHMEGRGKRFEGYSLLFRLSAGAPVPDGVVSLRHPALGATELYLGGVCGPVAPQRWEAIISRAV